MKARNLKLDISINLGEQREYNILIIDNMDVFEDECTNSIEFYKSKYKILGELEERILFKNNPEETIFIGYCPEGDVMFTLQSITSDNSSRYVHYLYHGTIR